MGVGVLVALALALAALALIATPERATPESARAYDEGCYWLSMERISEETLNPRQTPLTRGGGTTTPQTASMPSTAPIAALWASLAVRHEAGFLSCVAHRPLCRHTSYTGQNLFSELPRRVLLGNCS